MPRRVKRLLVLLVVLAGGLAAAAFSVPDEHGRRQRRHHQPADAQLRRQRDRRQRLLPVLPELRDVPLVGTGASSCRPSRARARDRTRRDHPTANSAFVASYLDTEIGHQLVLQVADARQVTVTPQQLADARTALNEQISSVMSEILQTAEGQNPRYSCSVTGQPLTGQEVLTTMPSSFVDAAGAVRRHRRRARGGPGRCRLQPDRRWRATSRDTTPSSTRRASTPRTFSSESAAAAAAAEVAFGTPFSTVATGATSSGTIPCNTLTTVAAELGVP